MLKRDERADIHSCWNRAKDTEYVFVLLERDLATAATIRFWCEERIRLGKNKSDDAQIVGALREADLIERLREVI